MDRAELEFMPETTMPQLLEPQIIADIQDNSRKITNRYIAALKEIDPKKEYILEGQTFHSLYWLVGHLAWAEHFLCVEATTDKKSEIPWLERFKIGTTLSAETDLPSFEEVLRVFDSVHEESMHTIRALTPEELDQENFRAIGFGAAPLKRVPLYHCIRHEPVHAGQMAWICKLNGIKMF